MHRTHNNYCVENTRVATSLLALAKCVSLVLDRDGNGSIDNGRELFGDSIPLFGGGNTADGVAALAAKDTNLDGKVDANDARFANLRIWCDANQDGISQASELMENVVSNCLLLSKNKTENSDENSHYF